MLRTALVSTLIIRYRYAVRRRAVRDRNAQLDVVTLADIAHLTRR